MSSALDLRPHQRLGDQTNVCVENGLHLSPSCRLDREKKGGNTIVLRYANTIGPV